MSRFLFLIPFFLFFIFIGSSTFAQFSMGAEADGSLMGQIMKDAAVATEAESAKAYQESYNDMVSAQNNMFKSFALITFVWFSSIIISIIGFIFSAILLAFKKTRKVGKVFLGISIMALLIFIGMTLLV